MKNRERGMETVELAIVGALAMFLLFGTVEVARLLYVWNTLSEATRRGARYAAVACQNDTTIKDITLFGTKGSNISTSPLVRGLTRSNVTVEYLDPVDGAPSKVKVSITGYQHSLLIPPILPGVPNKINAPTFATTLPAESLGGSGCAPP